MSLSPALAVSESGVASGLNPLTGLLAVLVAVVLLALAAEGVSRLAKLLGAPQSEPAKPPAQQADTTSPAPSAERQTEDPARIAAIITAAIKCVVPEDFRIVSIQLRQGDNWELLNTWAIEGRRQIYTSHKIR